MAEFDSVSIYDAHGFYKKDKEEVLELFCKCKSLLSFDERFTGGVRNRTQCNWYTLNEEADLLKATTVLDRILEWCDKYKRDTSYGNPYIVGNSTGSEQFRVGLFEKAIITVSGNQMPKEGEFEYSELCGICNMKRVRIFDEGNNSADCFTDVLTGQKHYLKWTEGYGSVDDADSFEIVEWITSKDYKKEIVDEIFTDIEGQAQSVILFEDKDNPYEKTFIGAKLEDGVLYVESWTVEYDGSYGLSVYVKKGELEKLCRVLSTDEKGLLSIIKQRFNDDGAEMAFASFCRSNGIECTMCRA